MTDQHASAAPAATAGDAPAPDRPRIYVACLAAYNAGHLHGRGLRRATPSPCRRKCNAMLAASPEAGADEWAIHDYEGFEGCPISEWASFDDGLRAGRLHPRAWRAWRQTLPPFRRDLDEARSALRTMPGQFRSAAEFAEATDHARPARAIPQGLSYYIDWEALARDMELNGEIIVFRLGLR